MLTPLASGTKKLRCVEKSIEPDLETKVREKQFIKKLMAEKLFNRCLYMYSKDPDRIPNSVVP